MGAQGRDKPAALILAAGEIRDYTAFAAGLSPGVFVVCADAGYQHCEKLNLKPDLLVGDFDSLDWLPPGVERVILDPDKNYCDSHHAVQEAVARGYRKLILGGMLGGGRPEHALANLQTLLWCAEQGLDAVLRDGISELWAVCGKAQVFHLSRREHSYFSVLAQGDCRGVTITGGRYPLDNYNLRPADPRAISNEFTDADVTIRMASGRLLVVCTPKDPR